VLQPGKGKKQNSWRATFVSVISKSNSPQLVLSFFADGPLWDNVVYTPAYPSGMSYFRPFRYRDKWIEDALLEKLKDVKKLKKIIGQQVILAMRFYSDPYASQVLPLRAAKIIHIDFIPDNICVYFQLQQFYKLDFKSTFLDQCLSFSTKKERVPKEKLFFCCESSSLPMSDKNEDEMWINWTNAISSDTSLPFNEKARRSVFVRISQFREKQLATITKIHRSWHRGAIYGFLAKEARKYELIFLHRVPFLFDKNSSVPQFKIKPESSTSNWEFSNIDEEITANYQLHGIALTAMAPSATWEQISLTPDKEELTTESHGKLYTLPIVLNIKIKKSFWHRFWTRHIWLILLGIVIIFKGVATSYLKGQPVNTDLVVGILTFLIIILGYVISQRKLLK
jgi:hypothetical protein